MPARAELAYEVICFITLAANETYSCNILPLPPVRQIFIWNCWKINITKIAAFVFKDFYQQETEEEVYEDDLDHHYFGVEKRKQKSNEKEKQKVSGGEAELGKKKRIVEKGKGIMVEDVVDVNKKKHVFPRSNGIVISEGVGSRSKSLLNVREKVAGDDNVGVNRAVRTRFVVLGLRACDNLDQ
ncbi:hypothetical protein Tco_1516414 [Tanacetum coccineum]